MLKTTSKSGDTRADTVAEVGVGMDIVESVKGKEMAGIIGKNVK